MTFAHTHGTTGKALKVDGATQIPAYVTGIPNGSEKGNFLAVDLGGSNCRICSVNLHGDSTYTMVQSKQVIPRHLMVNASYEPLFNFIAARIGYFIEEHLDPGVGRRNPWRLGFTFSFTYKNTSISSGIMLQWDKGWDIPDALGKDPCQMLQDEIDKLKLPVVVSALTNDSVGTLMARAYTSHWKSATPISVILGTGTNAAYIEDMENLSRPSLEVSDGFSFGDGKMVVNTEWGGWSDGDPGSLPTTRYDEILDRESSNPNFQLLEKRMSGLYVGELARLAILDLANTRLMNMSAPEDSPLRKQHGIDGAFLSRMAEDSGQNFEGLVHHISETLKAKDVSIADAQAIRLIAAAVVRRAARLVGAAMAAIITQSESRSKCRACGGLSAKSEAHSLPPSGKGYSRAYSSVIAFLSSIFPFLGLERNDHLLKHATDAEEETLQEQIYDIGVDGQMFEAYPTFEEDVREALRSLPQIGSVGERRIKIGLTKDGSAVGAALIAHSVDSTKPQAAEGYLAPARQDVLAVS